MDACPKENPSWKLVSGQVNQRKDHIKIRYGDNPIPVALVARGKGKSFTVQILLDSSVSESKSIIPAVWEELDFYLIKKREHDPWAYAKYHCGTAANLYSNVHWGWYPPGYNDSDEPDDSV